MLIKVKVFPESKEYKVTKKKKDEFEVGVKEKPREGEANQTVLELLSHYFKIPKNKLRIVKGTRRRNKILEIEK